MKQSVLRGILLVFIFFACQQEPEETMTKGKLHVAIPESIEPLLKAEIEAFSNLYKQNGAQLSYSITTSETAIKEFLRDTLPLCFTTIPFTEEQKSDIKNVSPDFSVTLFAYDAIIVCVNRKNMIRQITTEDVRKILTGEILRWEQLPRSQLKGSVQVALQDSADLVAYLRAYYRIKDFKIRAWRRVRSAREVMEEIQNDKYVLGFFSLSWLPQAAPIVVPLDVAPSFQPADTLFRVATEALGNYYSPHAAYLYWRYYPFFRPLYVGCRSLYGTLAAGFTIFILHNEGQTIVRDKGLLPGRAKIVLRPPQE